MGVSNYISNYKIHVGVPKYIHNKIKKIQYSRARIPHLTLLVACGITSQKVDSESILQQGHAPSYEDLCQFINDNAPHYFVPRNMEFVDSLPYTPTNKVQKYLLRQQGLGENTWDLTHSDYQVQRQETLE